MAKRRIPIKQSERADEFDKQHPHLAGFVHVVETLDDESDRGMVLILSGFLEEALKTMLVGFFQVGAKTEALFESGNPALGTFSARINLCHALGIINDKEREDLDMVRGLRNDFAHEVGASFSVESISARINNLSNVVDKKGGEPTPRLRYQFAAIGLIIGILRRLEHFRKNRRQPLDPNLVTAWEDVPALPPDAVLVSTGAPKK
jgi:DNA-binding MltR family transcriptional regulator